MGQFTVAHSEVNIMWEQMGKGLNSVARIPSHHIAAPIKQASLGKALSSETTSSPKISPLKLGASTRPALQVGSVERKKVVAPTSVSKDSAASIFPKKTKSKFVKTKPAIWEKGGTKMKSTKVV